MKPIIAMALALHLLGSTQVFASIETPNETTATMQIQIGKSGTQPSYNGSAEYFTGNVRVDPLFTANNTALFSGGYVTFEPRARTAWHTHPAGQRLIITAGVGWVQEWGGPVVEVCPGDVVWFPPGVKHWHGAAATSSMTHIALSGILDGKSVQWLEKVSNEQYMQ
ncbi:MAG: Cupin 2 conserved barrel domain protein [Firmicutes bacterium]|nr:Cupin 2 conserved barrel domain protein [Bacillota bacterium]